MYELMILIVGSIGVDEQAATVDIFQIQANMYMLALGLSQAASSLIGQQIGKGDVAVAQEYLQVCNHIGLIIFPSSIALLCIFRNSILDIFSPIQSVKDACILVWPIILTE